MSAPLDGIRVLDLTRLLPGAVCTLLLVDMGAEVIKVEDPFAGDYARWMPPLHAGQSAFFRATNRGKRSIALNLKQADGQRALHRLAASADVVVEGFRPGVTARLGCDYATLRAINPRIVYAALSGWGQDGPYAPVSGHDLNYVALSGLIGAMRTPQPLGGQVADVAGSYVGVMGILAALLRRDRTGEGAYIDVSLMESALPFVAHSFIEASVSNTRGVQGGLTGGMASYDVYISSDGQAMALSALEAHFWANFCKAVDRPDWVSRQHDADQEALRDELTALFATRTADEWDALLGPADCCFMRVVAPRDLPDDAHIQARGALGLTESGLPWLRSPIRMGSDLPLAPQSAPDHGEHTHAILAEAGYSDDEIAALLASGAAGKHQKAE